MIVESPLITVAVVTSLLWLLSPKSFGISFFPFGFSTTLLNDFYTSIGIRYRRFWKHWGKQSVTTVVPLATLGVYWFVIVFLVFVIGLTGRFAELYFLKQFVVLNFDSTSFWVVVLGSILLHEFAHAIVASSEDIAVENTGIISVPGFLYAGFVRVDYHSLLVDQLFEGVEFQSEEEKRVAEEVERVKKMTLKNNLNLNFEREKLPVDLREKILPSIAAGLLVNVLLVIAGVLTHVVLWQLGVSNQVTIDIIAVNLSLIALNVLPFGIFDGHKVLTLYLPEGARLRKTMKISSKLLELFFIFWFVLKF